MAYGQCILYEMGGSECSASEPVTIMVHNLPQVWLEVVSCPETHPLQCLSLLPGGGGVGHPNHVGR